MDIHYITRYITYKRYNKHETPGKPKTARLLKLLQITKVQITKSIQLNFLLASLARFILFPFCHCWILMSQRWYPSHPIWIVNGSNNPRNVLDILGNAEYMNSRILIGGVNGCPSCWRWWAALECQCSVGKSSNAICSVGKSCKAKHRTVWKPSECKMVRIRIQSAHWSLQWKTMLYVCESKCE